MMSGEAGAAQVVKPLAAVPALVTLAIGLGVVPTVLDDRIRGAVRTDHTLRPSHLPDGLVAFGVVEEVLDVDDR